MTAPLEPGRVGSRIPGRTDRRSAGALLTLGTAVAAASSFIPLSYDEGNWLAVARRVAGGETLYRDITDNKSPALFVLVRALDLAPGRYELARAIFLGAAAAVLAWQCVRLLTAAGLGDRAALALGLTVGLAGVMQAVLVVNFELPATILAVAGISLVVSDRDVVGGIVGGTAFVFDLRAVVLVAGIILIAYTTGGARRTMRVVLASAIPALGWGVFVLLNADLRYSLLELNVATRGGAEAWRPGSQLAAFGRAMVFPVVAVASLTARGAAEWRRFSIPAAVLVAGALGVALASVQPFDKYWTLALPGLVVFACSRVERPIRDHAKLVALLCIALAPSAVYAATTSSDQSAIVARYERAARDVARLVGDDGRIVRFDSNPFLGTFLPDRDLTPAAVLDFLIAPTSHERSNLAAVDAAISEATAIVDDGVLDVPEGAVLPAYRPLRAVFAARLAEFPCVRMTNGLTVRLRRERCPSS